MKCEQCGGNLTLEDVVCPYCEAVNPHAIQHIREMNRYKKEFEGTQKEVYSATRSYAGITARVIVLTVLIILTIICGVLGGEISSIRRNYLEKQAVKNAEETIEILEQYLDDRDYYAFYLYCEENSIQSDTKGYEEYSCILRMTGYYRYFYDSLMWVLKPYSGDNTDRNAEYLSTYINDFYKLYDEDTYNGIGDSTKNLEVAQGIEEQMKALLVAYCGVSKENADAFSEMTDAQRALAIEEGLLHD